MDTIFYKRKVEANVKTISCNVCHDKSGHLIANLFALFSPLKLNGKHTQTNKSNFRVITLNIEAC